MEPQTYVLIGAAVTVALFMLGGAFALGRLFQRVETNTVEISRIGTEVSQLTAEVRQLATQVQQLTDQVQQLATQVQQLSDDVRRTNEIVIALANHRHDVDGNTVFNLPNRDD
ncbi:MAG: hypothetical protein F4X64_17575 [Chloroflexi bacterium]|nr:hypothetical protein [Chloroflexota bacterium]